MSIHKPKGRPFWLYDFWIDNHRFFGTTGQRTKAEAREVENAAKDRARAWLKIQVATADGPLTLDIAIGRYWTEHGQRQKNATDLWRDFDDVAKLVAWRRGHHRRDDPTAPLITSAQVNRSTTEMLRRLFVRARKKWKVRFDSEPDWGEHLLAEPAERVRELRDDEDVALAAVMDPDYEALRRFSLASGLRQAESLLRWSQVDLAAGRIATIGKGGRPVFLPITSEMDAILVSRRGHHEVFVFTYVAKAAGKRPGALRERGARYPITVQGLKTHWRRRRALAGVNDFRWHDNRHDFGTKLLRATKNLKLVMRGLNHANITTTVKYAHVLDDELRAGMEAMARQSDENSQPNSQRRKPKTA
jgi:Phage integrase family